MQRVATGGNHRKKKKMLFFAFAFNFCFFGSWPEPLFVCFWRTFGSLDPKSNIFANINVDTVPCAILEGSEAPRIPLCQYSVVFHHQSDEAELIFCKFRILEAIEHRCHCREGMGDSQGNKVGGCARRCTGAVCSVSSVVCRV